MFGKDTLYSLDEILVFFFLKNFMLLTNIRLVMDVRKVLLREVLSFHSGLIEHSDDDECDAASLGTCFLTFRMNVFSIFLDSRS